MVQFLITSLREAQRGEPTILQYYLTRLGSKFSDDTKSRMKSGAGANYTYDGDRRRAKKSNGKLYWYGVDAEPLAESDLSGNISEEYIFFGGKRIARRVVSPSTVFYYFADHLGTSRVIVQANATTACYEADNTPYGKERVITDTCPQNYKFTGKERDSESSLDNMGARYYSWSFGRFQSPDLPFIDQHLGNPQSWNLYAYARNNPLLFTDPTGNAVDGPVGGTGLLPGVHHGGAVSPFMLSGATSYSWGYILLTVVGAESSQTTTTSADVQQATQQQSQATQQAANVNQLTQAQDAALQNPRFQPETTGQQRTFCNFATVSIAQATGAPTQPLINPVGWNGKPQPYLANQMAKNLASSPQYREVAAQEAQTLASQGKLVIGVQPARGHGHVATVRPDPTNRSSNPLIANIGRKVGIMPASQSFRSSPAVRYYTPR